MTWLIWRSWKINQLSKALNDLRSWEEDCDRHGIGKTAFSFDSSRCEWIVLVTEDLIKRVMPF